MDVNWHQQYTDVYGGYEVEWRENERCHQQRSGLAPMSGLCSVKS
jgi:hypothetical protein